MVQIVRIRKDWDELTYSVELVGTLKHTGMNSREAWDYLRGGQPFRLADDLSKTLFAELQKANKDRRIRCNKYAQIV